MILFLDAEFTGLNQPKPALISIGLVSDDGLHSFYAELTPDSYMGNVEPWVQANVLPFLTGGKCIMQLEDLRQRLTTWVEALGSAQIAVDSSIDFDFFCEVLVPFPTNIYVQPLFIAGSDFANAVERAYVGNTDLHRHHALDDAKANRIGWLAMRG